MKARHFLLGATLLSAGLLFNAPLFAAVESDVVGYTTITTNPGFNMQGVVFQGLEGKETIALDDLMSGEFQVGDQAQVYDGSGYTIYTYRGPEYGWMAGRKPASEVPVKAGDSFWLNTPDRSVEVTFAGSVKSGDFRYEAIEGMQMVSADFPIEFALNDETGRVTWTGVQTGDQIQVLAAGTGYTVYTYSQSAGKWLKGRNPTDARIPVGASMWMKCNSAGVVLQVANPLQ